MRLQSRRKGYIMRWVLLAAAIAFEILGTSFLKHTKGFTVLVPSIVTAVSYVLSFLLVSHAIKHIDLSIAYAIWCGGGILAITVIGFVFFHEPMSLTKAICIALVTIGCVGLELIA